QLVIACRQLHQIACLALGVPNIRINMVLRAPTVRHRCHIIYRFEFLIRNMGFHLIEWRVRAACTQGAMSEE
ncbi:MAG: hypothetical protein V3V97_02830, partial [Hyphomicrobiaceae bacterium]